MAVTEWRTRALCRGQSSRFFPEHGGKGAYVEARQLCARCPVREECLDYVLSVEDSTLREGFWAGMTPRGRRTEVERRREIAGWRVLERACWQGRQQRERLRFAREVFA